jgi:hypothetical protein
MLVQIKTPDEKVAEFQRNEAIRRHEYNQTVNFCQWLENATIGDKFCYFIGECLYGCTVGRLALNAYNNGRVTLYQKRIKPRQFAYWAERVAKSAKPECNW